MEYISAIEAAEKWDVSLRQVQRLLAADRIQGAKKYGRSWMIPEDAKKPNDPRREKKASEKTLSSELIHILDVIYIPAPRDNPDRVLETVGEERLRLIHEGALAYARGDFERTIRCFEKHDGDAAKLAASSIAIAAAISLGDYELYTEIEAYLKGIVQANISEDVTAVAQIALATGYLGAMAPGMVPKWLTDGDLAALPPVTRPNALYLRAKYFQCIGDYNSMLAVAQTALTFCGSEKGLSFPETYLTLMCAVANYALKRPDEAARFLRNAMRNNLPHGFITPIVELIPLFGGLTEQILEREYPASYDAVMEQWERTFKNWISFHNRFTEDNITLMLARQEYEVALLVAQGIPYAQIAEQCHLSVGTLKNKMSIVCEKLCITGRDRKKELAKFIL